ncbi:MAG: helix-turn-helix transcriptional regulator [Clostridia bacterium]|nr:helix-turn-helix transcriptional regulator [Clostridia bacterium]
MKSFFEKPIILNETIGCHFVAPGTGTPIHRNRYLHGIVYYPEDTTVFSFIDGPDIQTRQGSIVYLPKGSNYNVIQSGKIGQGCWCINFDTVNELSAEPFVLELRSPEKAQNLFAVATKIYRERRTAFDPKIRSIFYEILGLMEMEYAQKYTPSSKARIIAPAIDYIKKNCYDKPISSDELAAMCGVSGTYFRRVFSDVYGTTPVKYINSIKISRAKELIDSGMYASVSDIAYLCGFTDDCYFRKVFKSETRMTPLEYKKRRD